MSNQLEDLQKLIKNLPDPNLKKELANVVDSYTGVRITEGLKTTFGDHHFKVTIKNFFKPALNGKGGAFKYVVEHISWEEGPNAHQVFFYLKEEFGTYLNLLEFDRRIFTRRLPGIERKLINWFLPLKVANTQFNAIEVTTTRVENKINDKVTNSYFRIDSKDPLLEISVKGETLEEALGRFQNAVEDIYYSENYNKTRKHLESKYQQSTEELENSDEILEK